MFFFRAGMCWAPAINVGATESLKSKKSPAVGPTGSGPRKKPAYLMARAIATYGFWGPLGFGPMNKFWMDFFQQCFGRNIIVIILYSWDVLCWKRCSERKLCNNFIPTSPKVFFFFFRNKQIAHLEGTEHPSILASVCWRILFLKFGFTEQSRWNRSILWFFLSKTYGIHKTFDLANTKKL